MARKGISTAKQPSCELQQAGEEELKESKVSVRELLTKSGEKPKKQRENTGFIASYNLPVQTVSW